MKAVHSRILMGIAAGILCAAGALVWTGCDVASANESLTISPSSATLSSGQSAEFTVSGGYEYTWSLVAGTTSSTTTVSSTTGSLSSRTGNRVVYTAPTSASGLSGGVTLRVTSTITGTADGSTNSSAYAVSADASITFK